MGEEFLDITARRDRSMCANSTDLRLTTKVSVSVLLSIFISRDTPLIILRYNKPKKGRCCVESYQQGGPLPARYHATAGMFFLHLTKRKKGLRFCLWKIQREKLRQKGEETPQNFRSLWVPNWFFLERGGGNNMIHLHNIYDWEEENSFFGEKSRSWGNNGKGG